MAGAIGSIGGPIVAKSAADRIVKAPVLTPGEPDRERHTYSEKNIAEIAQSFLPDDGSIDAMHAGGDVGHPTESYVAPQQLDFGDRTVPAGSWVIGAKIADDQVWQGVESGEYQGVSVFGPVRAVYDGDGNQLDIKEIARPVGGSGGAGAQPAVTNSFAGGGPSFEIPPAPVGETWTVEFDRATHVSIVDDPAVQAASFVVAKSASGQYGSEELTMDQDTEERFDELEALVQKSAESAEAAAESAEEAQTAAEEAVENADPGGDGGDGGGPDGGSDALDAVEDLRADLEDSGVLGDGGGSGDGSGAADNLDIDGDLDDDTVQALADGGVIDEETAAALAGGDVANEKRLAAIEKKLDQLTSGQSGRQGLATQLDGSEGEEENGTGLVGSDDRAAAIKHAGSAGSSGGDDE
jgi:hypothetical protein